MTLFVYLNHPHPDRALIESLTIKNINRINLNEVKKARRENESRFRRGKNSVRDR